MGLNLYDDSTGKKEQLYVYESEVGVGFEIYGHHTDHTITLSISDAEDVMQTLRRYIDAARDGV